MGALAWSSFDNYWIDFRVFFDKEKKRKPSLKKMMKKTPGVAVAIDNCCALEIVDDKFAKTKEEADADSAG